MVKITKVREMLMKFPAAIATTNTDGTPNIAVAAYIKLLDKDHLLITQNYMMKTIKNIQKNSHITLAVWDNGWNGIRIFGEAEYHNSGEYFDMVKSMPENANENPQGALLVKIERMEEIG